MAVKSSTAERLEWALGLAAASIVLGIAGYLAVQGVTESRTLPDLRAAILPASEGSPAGQLRFVVTNEGGRTATAVSLAMILRDGDRVVAERHLTLDYVPGNSRATGGFLLPPGSDGLTPVLVVEGYVDP